VTLHVGAHGLQQGRLSAFRVVGWLVGGDQHVLAVFQGPIVIGSEHDAAEHRRRQVPLQLLLECGGRSAHDHPGAGAAGGQDEAAHGADGRKVEAGYGLEVEHDAHRLGLFAE